MLFPEIKGFFVVEEDDSGNNLITASVLALAELFWSNNDRPLPVETFAKILFDAAGEDDEILFDVAVHALSSLPKPERIIDELNSSAEMQEDNMLS